MKHHHLLEPNKTVLVGVSGGPDSLALLSFLLSIRDDWNLTLIALSVDHQLRGEDSQEDLAYVKYICEKRNIMFEGTSVDVALYKVKHQVGTQVAARELRYTFFKEQMEKHHASFLALGHHADDQLETMIMNLARSSNPKALSGIPIKRQFATGMVIRPLLCVTKEEIESYCRTKGIIPRMDASNEDTAYTRNAVRKNIAPLFKELNPNVHAGLQHLSESLQADAALLTEQAGKMVADIVTFAPRKTKASFEMKTFQSYPSALQRRAYHLILNHLYKELPKNLSYIHEENFFCLLKSYDGNKEMDLPGKLKVVKSYGNVTFYMEYTKQSSNNPYNILLTVPGETILPDGSRLIAKQVKSPSDKGKYTYVCNPKRVPLPLHIRTRKEGDRMGWKGLHGRKKIKDIFIDNKIPPEERVDWPIITDDTDQILWVVGLKKNQEEQQTTEQLYIQLTYER